MSCRPLIIAHRGFSLRAPENTLEAIRLAVASGADGIEIDVRITRDGVPVVIHDGSLWRTGGVRKNIGEIDYSDLAGIDVGSWFDRRYPALAQPAFREERVPRLEQVLELLAGGDGLLYVELKCRPRDRMDLVNRVCEVIESSPLLPKIIMKSFDLGAVTLVKSRLPEVQTAAIFGPDMRRIFIGRGRLIDIAQSHSADQLSLHYSLVTRSLMDAANAAAMPVTVWTVDHRRRMKRLQALNVHALITNDPGSMLSEPPASAGAEPDMSVPPAVAGG